MLHQTADTVCRMPSFLDASASSCGLPVFGTPLCTHPDRVCASEVYGAWSYPPEVPAASDTVWVLHRIDASEIYGACSYVPAYPAASDAVLGVTHEVGYQVSVVFLLLTYIALTLGFGRDIKGVMPHVWGKSPERGKRDGDLPAAGVQAVGIGCGVLMTGVASIRLCELFTVPLPLLSWVPGWIVVLAIALLAAAVMALQKLILDAAGYLALCREQVRVVSANRFGFFISLTLTGTPALLLAALSTGWWPYAAAGIFVTLAAAHAILYTVKSFFLFAEQKISILLWILYLCTVEVMPPCIAVIGLMRSWPG